ncbi:hypothetical protein [Helicobacter bilis]|uniref:hypothetical protein n=1 Tax=Helicobacter bilis TaxID=37372 RepID=UPI0012DAFE56|nr:hypothetical protein [Helicobacter bilis]
MYALCVCKGLNMLLCSALSVAYILTISKALIYMQRLYYVYVLLYALIDLYVYGFT